MPKTNFLEIRKANDAKLITYAICIGLSIIFFLYLLTALTEKTGYGILWLVGILIFILILVALSAWLPKVTIHIDNEEVIISEGIGIKNEIDKVPLNKIKKIRFHTYKEATAKSSKYSSMGGAVRASGSNIEGSISIGGAFSVLLILHDKKQIEFGFYLSKEKALVVRKFIEIQMKPQDKK